MFLSTNNLSEGGLEEGRCEARKKELYEGENPKSEKSIRNLSGWKALKPLEHVNSNWEKLR